MYTTDIRTCCEPHLLELAEVFTRHGAAADSFDILGVDRDGQVAVLLRFLVLLEHCCKEKAPARIASVMACWIASVMGKQRRSM